jgi:hypothetical protein
MVFVYGNEYMQNGDFLHIQLQAQQNAANVVCHSKTHSNPENNVGFITLANDYGVVTTLTPDTGHILSKLSNPRAVPFSALASKRPIWLRNTCRARIIKCASLPLWEAPWRTARRIW